MAASKRYVNIASGSFAKTYPTTATIAVATIQSIDYKSGAKRIQASGDADFFMTFSRTISGDPGFKVKHQDVGLLSTVPVGAKGTFSFIAYDAENDAGTGAVTFSLANAHVVEHDAALKHHNLADVSLDFASKSSDGTTSPLTLTIAS